MASLRTGVSVGGSTSSLLRSATRIQDQLSTYTDSLEAFKYANSAYTDDAYSSYKDYLQGRIDALSSTGTISGAQKALTLTKTLEAATKNNISSTIQRENIQVMAGNAALPDKYAVIVSQYERAVNNGDMTLAQSLMGQAYSVSQQIQYQQQQAQDAANTLAKANAAAAKTAQEGKVSYQSEVVQSLDNGLKELNNAAKGASEADFNKTAQEFVKSNADALKALGVVLPDGAQPNYFDIVSGVAGAKYNALVLKAQAEAPLNPQTAQNYAYEAQFLNNGVTKISTLGGDLTLQELQQAAQDPNMFSYDQSSGTYRKTSQTGYQFINGQIAPTYSGIVDTKTAFKSPNTPQFLYLTANETKQLSKLGFSVNAKLNPDGTVGSGIFAQASDQTPDWLKSIFGNKGEAQFYNQNGSLTFKSGNSFYSIVTDYRGMQGLLQHSADGSLQIAGGEFGFDAQGMLAAQMLVQKSQMVEKQLSEQQLRLAQSMPQPNLNVGPPPPTQNLAPAQVAPPASLHLGSPPVPQLHLGPAPVNTPAPNIQQNAGRQILAGGGPGILGGGGGIILGGAGGNGLLQPGGAGIRL